MEISFSKRLITARKMAGYSIQELAVKTGISKQAISQYEKGAMMPGSDKQILLSQALKVKLDFFYRSPQSSDIILATQLHFREGERIDKDELEIIKIQASEHLQKYFEIERIADVRDEFKNPIQDLVITTKKNAVKAAKQVRRKWKLGNLPLRNVIAILEAKGIKIYEVQASESFNGFAAWAGKIPVIVVNKGINEVTRVRFTTLHELGHLILNIDEGVDAELIERICDTFASELLFPSEMLVVEIGTRRTRISMQELCALKENWGVSIQSIMVKLALNDIVSWSAYQIWKAQCNNLSHNEDAGFGKYTGDESTKRFEQLLFKCLMENKISLNKALGLSEKSSKELNKAWKKETIFFEYCTE